MTDKGLVMEMESSFLSFRASNIRFEKVADSDVMPPAGSVSLTKAEFDKIKQE